MMWAGIAAVAVGVVGLVCCGIVVGLRWVAEEVQAWERVRHIVEEER